MSQQVVKIFMLLCVILLCGAGYIYITADLGFAEPILDNSTGNASFIDEGHSLVESSDSTGTAILIFAVILFAIMVIFAIKQNGWI